MLLVVATPAVLFATLGLAFALSRDRTLVVPLWSLVALGASVWVCSTVEVELFRLLASLLLNVGELSILAAVALLFSSFSTPFLTGVFTFGVWLVGRSADDMVAMKTRVLSPGVKKLLGWLAEVLPNFNLFVPGRTTLVGSGAGLAEPLAYVATALGYAVLYAGITLGLAALIFRRRDFL
jgi:ABC-type transport system involved in multi-copper enzyme maturation permease subunit